MSVPALFSSILPLALTDRLARHAHHARGTMVAETERTLRRTSSFLTVGRGALARFYTGRNAA